MKIIKTFIIILFLFSCLYCKTNSGNSTRPLRKNQVSAFPNTYESPINSSLLKDAHYEPPLLSKSLIELDPTQKIKKSQFLETIKYPLYKLTRGELELIFSFIDTNRDDLIDLKEWENFSTLYILPFEACDSKGKMLLNENDFRLCFESDPKRGLVTFRRRYSHTDQIAKMIIDTISTRGTTILNIFDYILFRRALYSWTRCQSSGKYIAKSHFKCAITMFIPNKYMNKIDTSLIYDTGLRIAYDKNLIELDFIAYLRIAYFSFVYSVFNESNVHNLPFLEKTRFLKSIHEDRFPNNFDEDEVNLIYALTNNGKLMEFGTFCFFFNLHRLFNKYSIQKPLKIHKSELLLLLDDTQTPKESVNLIDDSSTNFTLVEYQEASLILGRRRVNEASFFSFKQDSSAESNATYINSTIFASANSFSPDVTAREYFFNVMCGLNKNFWGKAEFYKAFSFANLFQKVSELQTGGGSNLSPKSLLDYLPRAYDLASPSINAAQRKNLIFYKNIPNEIKIDLLAFLSVENFISKLNNHNFNTDTIIEESTLKIIMKDYGMINLPDTVLDLTIKGYDSLRRRQFKALDTFKNMITVHASAAEIRRTNNNINGHKLPKNTDLSRSFPTGNRRFLSTPLV